MNLLRQNRRERFCTALAARSQAINGAKVQALGALRYRAVASPDFIKRYRLDQDLPSQLPQAPCLVFNQDDQLQHQYLLDVCGKAPQKNHLCPSSEGFLRATLAGLGFGLLPELQMQPYLENKQLIDLTPNYHLDTPLYWHYWQSESPLMAQLRQQITL